LTQGIQDDGSRPRDWEALGKEEEADSLHTDTVKKLKDIPEFVLRHAPLVHLYSGENFWPSDIAEHVKHMTPYINGSAVNMSKPTTLANLHKLNSQPGRVFLTSDENVESRPEWLHSHVGLPEPFEEGELEGDFLPPSDQHRQTDTTWWEVDKEHPLRRISDPRRIPGRKPGRKYRLASRSEEQYPLVPQTPMYKPDISGYSKAPAVLVLVDKGSGILDAFWFFFYSYNLGQTVLNIRFGNHVGDWEHCMVRFENGVPRALFMSEHEGGQAYAWNSLERLNKTYNISGVETIISRPVVYSAVGSHAMYATPGDHAYVLPFNMLKDVTDRGPVWDPAMNTYAYFYDYEKGRDESASKPKSLTPAASNPDAPTSWFHYSGPWGDELYQLRDERQWRIFGQYHYVTGPLGPKFKMLERERVCQTWRCRILQSIEAGKKAKWYS
jgi:hypothetical protein